MLWCCCREIREDRPILYGLISSSNFTTITGSDPHVLAFSDYGQASSVAAELVLQYYTFNSQPGLIFTQGMSFIIPPLNFLRQQANAAPDDDLTELRFFFWMAAGRWNVNSDTESLQNYRFSGHPERTLIPAAAPPDFDTGTDDWVGNLQLDLDTRSFEPWDRAVLENNAYIRSPDLSSVANAMFAEQDYDPDTHYRHIAMWVTEPQEDEPVFPDFAPARSTHVDVNDQQSVVYTF